MPKPVKRRPSKIYYLGIEDCPCGTEPIVFDFGSLSETSQGNCFGCDSCNCNCDADQAEHQRTQKTLRQITLAQNTRCGQIATAAKSHNL